MGYNVCGANPITKGKSMNKRKILIAAAALMLLQSPASPAYPAAQAAYTAQLSAAGQVLTLTNEYRARAGAPMLVRSAELDRAAAVRAQEIATHFSHTRPDGRSWSSISSAAFGENIARGHRNAEKAVLAWMNSAGHRANMLRGSYASIGIAAVEIGGTMYWVQLFGR